MRFSGRPAYDATGKHITRIYGAGEDITDVKLLEALARLSAAGPAATGENDRDA